MDAPGSKFPFGDAAFETAIKDELPERRDLNAGGSPEPATTPDIRLENDPLVLVS